MTVPSTQHPRSARDRQPSPFWVGLAMIGLVAASCSIGAGSFAGKACENSNDCPAPFVCAQVRPGPRTCELVHGIDLGSGGGSGGTGGSGGSNPPDYCHDVKKILDRTCVSNCHGVDNTGSGLSDRFDVYSLGGSPPGAYELATTIKDRVASGSMPPFGANNPRPTPDERTILIRWATTGAAKCFDGGIPFALDAGSADGG